MREIQDLFVTVCSPLCLEYISLKLSGQNYFLLRSIGVIFFFFFPVGMLSTSYKVMFMFWLVFHFRDYLKIYMT